MSIKPEFGPGLRDRDTLAEELQYLLYLLVEIQEKWRSAPHGKPWSNARFARKLNLSSDMWEKIRRKVENGEPHTLGRKSLAAIYNCDLFPMTVRALAWRCWWGSWLQRARSAGLLDDDAEEMILSHLTAPIGSIVA